jgi:hypothetical protein
MWTRGGGSVWGLIAAHPVGAWPLSRRGARRGLGYSVPDESSTSRHLPARAQTSTRSSTWSRWAGMHLTWANLFGSSGCFHDHGNQIFSAIIPLRTPPLHN